MKQKCYHALPLSDLYPHLIYLYNILTILVFFPQVPFTSTYRNVAYNPLYQCNVQNLDFVNIIFILVEFSSSLNKFHLSITDVKFEFMIPANENNASIYKDSASLPPCHFTVHLFRYLHRLAIFTHHVKIALVNGSELMSCVCIFLHYSNANHKKLVEIAAKC